MCRLASVTSDDKSPTVANHGSCPFSIQQLNPSTYLIRENDDFGEYPHIYAKVCTYKGLNGDTQSVIVLSDTGVGTTTSGTSQRENRLQTIRTFLESHLNQDASIPYLIILSHCHYDHILGLEHFLPSDEQSDSNSQVAIVSSAHDPSFVQPYESLQKHSLCEYYHKRAPRYKTDFWAEDDQKLTYTTIDGQTIDLGIILLHAPGHTPDSLSWYDTTERCLFVGDSFYQQTSKYTQDAPWGPETPAPIIFPFEGNLFDWWQSIKKLQLLVERENEQLPPVRLAAGHVTAQVDAQSCLSDVKAFMARILRGQVPCERLPDREGKARWHWKDRNEVETGHPSEFSVVAPEEVIEDGKANIPRDEWQSG